MLYLFIEVIEVIEFFNSCRIAALPRCFRRHTLGNLSLRLESPEAHVKKKSAERRMAADLTI